MWPSDGVSREMFIARACSEGAAHYRDLPWRYVDDAYAVLVSEIMLQQTQVARVERFWRRFLDLFPTLDALASASTSDVLAVWQGLGYNRRALALLQTAQICSADFGGDLPRDEGDLLGLPGIGPATAAGIRAFVWNEPGVYVETNVRAVFIHELFADRDKVSDRELVPLIADVCPKPGRAGGALRFPSGAASGEALPGVGQSRAPEGFDPSGNPRDWYYALLDWGAYLKACGVNPTRQSAAYSRQSAFVGSRRQKRAWIVRRILAADGRDTLSAVHAGLDEAEAGAGREAVSDEVFSSIVDDLCAEGFFRRDGDCLVAL